jgi:hypothetical protein
MSAKPRGRHCFLDRRNDDAGAESAAPGLASSSRRLRPTSTTRIEHLATKPHFCTPNPVLSRAKTRRTIRDFSHAIFLHAVPFKQNQAPFAPLAIPQSEYSRHIQVAARAQPSRFSKQNEKRSITRKTR